MRCKDIEERIDLYLYGELDSAETELLERHFSGCPDCRTLKARAQALHTLLDQRAIEPPPSLAVECRNALMSRLEPTGGLRRMASIFLGSPGLPADPVARLRRLAGAFALVALGFVSARMTPPRPGGSPGQGAVGTASIGPDALAPDGEVSRISPDASGRVRIEFDRSERHEFQGSLQDAQVLQLLLRAARNPSNPGLRLESVGLLKDRSDSEPVRAALLHALATDPNPGVRFEALDGLESSATDPRVREALGKALLADSNAGVRVQIIEVLTRAPDESIVGVLQDVVQRETNNYVRLRVSRALREMNASVGTF